MKNGVSDRTDISPESPEELIVPIFILGADHSGTTILYKMMAMHPDVAWLSQYSQRGGRIPGLRRIPLHNRIDVVLRKVLRHNWRKAGRSKLERILERIVPEPDSARPIWQSYVFGLPTPLGAERIRDRLYGVFGDSPGVPAQESIRRMRHILLEECTLWRRRFHLSKPHRQYRQLSLMRAAFPRAKFVHIVRDGRAVALSNRAKFARLGVEDSEALSLGARRWLDEVEVVGAEADKGGIVEVRYEDFCKDVPGELGRILAQVGLDNGRFPFQRCPVSLSPTNRGWFERVPLEDIAMLESTLAHQLGKYGYEQGPSPRTA